MKNETKLIKFSRVYLKVFYIVWAVLLAGLMIASLVLEDSASMLPFIALILFGGAAIYRMWKNAVVEIIIEEGVAHMEFFSKKIEHIKIEAIVRIRETSMGPVLTMSDGEEFRSMNGPFRVIIRNGEHATREFRQEDFPYAEIDNKLK